MAIFRSHDFAAAPEQQPSSLRLPASKRISSTASERLTTIMESDRHSSPAPPIPLRSSLRRSSVPSTVGSTHRPWHLHPAFRSVETFRTGPPSYHHVARTSVDDDDEDLTAPVEGEKLARLRRGEHDGKKTRGGLWRLLLVTLIVLAIVALAVGLGVGLTVGKRRNSDDGSTNGAVIGSGTTNTPQALPFPLGEYSFVTALRTQQTNCSAKAAAWRCYPYSTFAESNTTSQATFNWIISNTSSTYALNTTGATSADGIPANLTISTQNNPFAISFTNQSLTYINDSNNSSSPRYSFEFTMSKVVVPSPAITSNNQASQCFFNSTVFAGFLYLGAQRNFPDAQLRGSTAIGGYTQWPFAVEITQTSPGGDGVPDCYETINGVSDARIINGLDPQPQSSTCLCDYRNY